MFQKLLNIRNWEFLFEKEIRNSSVEKNLKITSIKLDIINLAFVNLHTLRNLVTPQLAYCRNNKLLLWLNTILSPPIQIVHSWGWFCVGKFMKTVSRCVRACTSEKIFGKFVSRTTYYSFLQHHSSVINNLLVL